MRLAVVMAMGRRHKGRQLWHSRVTDTDDPGMLLLLAVVRQALVDVRRKSTPPGYRYDAMLFLQSVEFRELLALLDVELDDWRRLIGEG